MQRSARCACISFPRQSTSSTHCLKLYCQLSCQLSCQPFSSWSAASWSASSSASGSENGSATCCSGAKLDFFMEWLESRAIFLWIRCRIAEARNAECKKSLAILILARCCSIRASDDQPAVEFASGTHFLFSLDMAKFGNPSKLIFSLWGTRKRSCLSRLYRSLR